jgi:hypothetical protein
VGNFYSRGMRPVARVIKPQDKTLSQQLTNAFISVLFDHITTCFGLYMWPSSGDFCDIKILKIEVTTRYNGSVESNGM